MIIESISNVDGKSMHTKSAQLDVKFNLRKKYYGNNTQPYKYVGQHGNYNVIVPNEKMRLYMFDTQKRRNTNADADKGMTSVKISNIAPPMSIFSIQKLGDILAPGNINRSINPDEKIIEANIWNAVRQNENSILKENFGELNNEPLQLAQRNKYRLGVEGQSIYQGLNHIAVDNLASQISAPISVQPGSHLSRMLSSVNQSSTSSYRKRIPGISIPQTTKEDVLEAKADQQAFTDSKAVNDDKLV